jgi:hypothetical protein
MSTSKDDTKFKMTASQNDHIFLAVTKDVSI